MLKKEAPIVHLKWLKLITPDKAKSLGLVTEAPVFTSPVVNEETKCIHCLNTYSPIMYPHETTVQAQHFCPIGGGLYHYSSLFLPEKYDKKLLSSMGFSEFAFPGWQAQVKPEFPIRNSENEARIRNTLTLSTASFLFVEAIQAYCAEFDQHDGYPLISEGTIQESKALDYEEKPSGILKAFCSDHQGNSNLFNPPSMRFSLKNDGSIGFSYI